MSQDDVNLILIRAIHQILHRLRSKVGGSDKEAVENVLANLETTDPDFNSYSFVRLLRKRIETAISSLVESKLECVVLEGDGHDAVPLIVEEVMASPIYAELFESVLSDVKVAMDTMLQNQSDTAQADDSSDTHTPQGGSALLSTTSSSSTHFLNLDDSMASGLSAVCDFNQTGMLFMTAQQFSAIVGGIAQSEDKQKRLESLHHLLHFPTGDTLNTDDWPAMRSALLAALAEPRVDISILALKFVARMLSAATMQTAKEGFSILVEHMSAYYQSCDSFPVAMVTGIDLEDEECVAIMKRFRLIDQFMVEVPNYWLRYSHSVVELLVSQCLSLLSLPSPSPPSSLTPVVTPLHFISLLDPQAVWFRKWMHGQYSRNLVLKHLKGHPKVLEDCVRAILGFEGFVASCPSPEPHRTSAQTTHYSEEEITYAFFVHALSVVERVLLFTDGWKLFPLSVDSTKAPVTPLQVLTCLINLIFTSHFIAQPHTQDFCPVNVVVSLFHEIALSSRCCKELVCVEPVVSSLLQPLKAHLNRTLPAWKPSADTLHFVADILAVIASQEHGRHFLLYGPKGKIADINYSAPAHTIAHFTVSALKRSLSPPIPPEVAVAFIFVCRQCYNTCDGLLVFKEYTLHRHIAAALTKSSGNLLSEDAVLDNMLNFAATPQGLLLLHQTGVLLPCVVYMLQRYRMKLQVSKCQKFGYGCMVTQVASTAAGMKALMDSGFVSMFVDSLWDVLDGDDDERLVSASTGPLDPTDRVAHKALVNLLNVLSAFPAVYEALLCAPQRDLDHTVLGLLTKLVLWEGEERGRGLMNPEDAHMCGLRILGVLITSLDTFLLLESHCHITSILLSLQTASKLPDGNYIIDAQSVERNWILVATHCTGGPNERVLPPHTLTGTFNWPLFSAYPVPKEYCKGRKEQHGVKGSASKDFKSLQSFLSQPLPSSTAEADKWLDKCRSLLVQVLSTGKIVPSTVLFSLLQSYVSVTLVDPTNKSLPEISHTTNSRLLTLPKEGVLQLGSTLAVRYGEQMGALKPDARETEERALEELQWKIGRMLAAQQHQRPQWELGYLATDYPGYDWFVASLFLLARGSAHTSEVTRFMISFSQLLLSCFIWPQRAHKSAHLPLSIAASGMPPLLYVTAHCIEMLLEVEVPHVHSAFKISGYTPAQICQHWLTQCFWNYLDWDQVVLYLTLCVVMGVDYQVYFCVAVFKFLEKNILKHVQEQNLLVFLKEEPFREFSVQDHLLFMKQLEKKHRHAVLKDMKQFASL